MEANKIIRENIIFISWSGAFGKELANHLKDEMLNYSPLEGWVSDQDIGLGLPPFTETNNAIANSAFGIICLTPGSSNSRWLNYEAGGLYNNLKRCFVLEFYETPLSPLKELQKADGTKKESWIRILKDMTEHLSPKVTDKQISLWVDGNFPKLVDFLHRLDDRPYSYYSKLGNTTTKIIEKIDNLKNNTNAQENVLFQHVITNSFKELEEQLNNIDISFSVPASKYPSYLLSIQQNSIQQGAECIVQAVALVNVEEDFWNLTLGNKIRQTSSKNNVRVFSFKDDKDFIKMHSTLKEHSRNYNVYAISKDKLVEILGSYYKDFSIIESEGKKMLAFYDKSTIIPDIPYQKNIKFTTDINDINEHQNKFNELIESKAWIQINDNQNEELEQLTSRVFEGLSAYNKFTVEMSEYIDVSQYDEHEERHAFYQDMMNKMLEIFSTHRGNNRRSVEVLEFGAGTGIFTMRLFEEQNLAKLSTVEIDWHCYKVLISKLKKFDYAEVKTNKKGLKLDDPLETILTKNNGERRMELYCADSRKYNPPGKFDYIFSSFADHHIKIEDKTKYFDNVKNNLKPGALFIVGDEFLPEHDINDEQAWKEALTAYHTFIINIALEQNEHTLAALENAALISGLLKKGDFKLSCKQYENILEKAGFTHDKVKIGPLDRDDVGGVYVYTIALKT